MGKKGFFGGILVVILVFGMTVIGCNKAKAKVLKLESEDKVLKLESEDKVLKLESEDAEGYYKRGLAYLEAKKKSVEKDNWGKATQEEELAFADFAQALSLKPDYAIVYNERGDYYKYIDEEKALAEYTSAVQADPNWTVPLLNRASLYSKMDQFDEAIADYSRALEIDPDNEGAASGLESNRYAKQREEERLAEEKRREERDAYLAQYPRFTVKEINDMREPNPYKFEQEWLGKTILITGEFWIINYGRMGLKDDDFSSVWCNFSGENRNQLYEPKHKEGDKIRVLGTVAPGEFITLNNCSLE